MGIHSHAVPPSLSEGRAKPLILGVVTLLVVITLAYWGGLPPASEIPKFVVGLVALLGVGTAIIVFGWYLLLRPVPVEIVKKNMFRPAQRQLMGVILIVGTALEAIGGNWDEAWHAIYGIPFGKDFFWRPHILIYTALLTVIAVSWLAWYLILNRAKGTWVQRFRADPLVGIVALMGLILVYAVPADPLWHAIYGSDISAFSVPHVLLTLLLLIAFLVGIGLLISDRPSEAWNSIRKVAMADVMSLTGLSFALLTLMLMLTADWFSLTMPGLTSTSEAALQRPEWVFPALNLFLAVWFGTMANHTLRRVGASTLLGVLTYLIRSVLIVGFATPIHNANTWLLVIPPMVTIDLGYAFQLRRGQVPSWWLGGIAGSIGGLVSLPLINSFLTFPQITTSNLPVMLLFPTLAALLGSWIGQTLGDYLTPRGTATAIAKPEMSGLSWWVIPVLLLTSLIFLILFVVTATPPTFSS
ncbi:MAG: hypothetical protein ACYDBJ_28750 [Aggregatilineales bacterium]